MMRLMAMWFFWEELPPLLCCQIPGSLQVVYGPIITTTPSPPPRYGASMSPLALLQLHLQEAYPVNHAIRETKNLGFSCPLGQKLLGQHGILASSCHVTGSRLDMAPRPSETRTSTTDKS